MAFIEQGFGHRVAAARAETRRAFSISAGDRKFLVTALVVLCVLRIGAAMVFPYVDTTEARYAEIARIMLETGDWITPQFDYGVPFWGKPPLHTWLSAAGMAVFGVNEFGGRVLILATALAALALVFAWVRSNRGADEALVTLVVLFSSVMFFGASAFVMTDMVMTLGLVLCMVGFHRAVTQKDQGGRWFHLCCVGLAIGLLAKGPVALVLAGLALVPWLVLSGRWRAALSLPWMKGALVVLVLTAPWYVAAELKTPGFLNYFLIGEHFHRFVVSGWEGDLYGSGHARPLGIVWVYWIASFLPWTFFVGPVLWNLRRGPVSDGSRVADWEGYLACWAIAPLILFSPAANLLSAYVLPGLPATAILLVAYWARYCGGPGRWSRVSFAAATGVVPALFAAVSLVLLVSPQTLRLKTERELVDFAQTVDPALHLTYWGRRTFSADFYTRGAADYAIRTSDFDDLRANTVKDAVAVHEDDLPAVAPFLAEGFRNVGVFGRRALFIEINTQGDAS